MTDRPQSDPPTDSLTTLGEAERAAASCRFEALRPHIQHGVTLNEAASAANVPVRTLQRWVARYRKGGLAGLARRRRSDAGRRRLPPALVAAIEGLALCTPRLTDATIHRRLRTLVDAYGWPMPSYSAVHAIVRQLDPGLVTLAHDGAAAYRDRFELIHRHRADRPNALWQADHTQLDLTIVDANGNQARPWLTVVIDDHSRAVAGYTVFLGAPSALQTALALRQAIWRKADPAWPMCGIPDALYVDHGSDFNSCHLEQVSADLRIELTFSAVGRPQGRGKVERFFGTLNSELLPELPGYLAGGQPAKAPRLSLSDLDRVLGAFITHTYHVRVHREIGVTPNAAWVAEGWLPRLPHSLDELDLLLISVAKSRRVRRDGIHFEGLRYLDPTLAAYVGEAVTIRYDPRDITEFRVFHRDRFLCRAVSPDHAAIDGVKWPQNGQVENVPFAGRTRVCTKVLGREEDVNSMISRRRCIEEDLTFIPAANQHVRTDDGTRGSHHLVERHSARAHRTPKGVAWRNCAPQASGHGISARTSATAGKANKEEALHREACPLQGGPAAVKVRARRTGSFIATREYRRFVEFASAARRHATIGLCHGPAGVGKTLSARRYARWDLVEQLLTDWGPRGPSNAKVYAALARSRTVFYTPAVVGSMTELRKDFSLLTRRVHACIEQGLGPKSWGRARSPMGLVELVIIDEAERLTTAGLEYFRDQFDRSNSGLILIGMPGIEQRMGRYPQLYSRIGFSHRYSPLSKDELHFVLTRHWRRLSQEIDVDDFTDAQATAAIVHLTGGNFRLLHRLFVQIDRVVRINELTAISEDVVETAASALVIGHAT